MAVLTSEHSFVLAPERSLSFLGRVARTTIANLLHFDRQQLAQNSTTR